MRARRQRTLEAGRDASASTWLDAGSDGGALEESWRDAGGVARAPGDCCLDARRGASAGEERRLHAGGDAIAIEVAAAVGGVYAHASGYASGQAHSCHSAGRGVTTQEECGLDAGGLDADAETSALAESCAGGGSDASERGDSSLGGARWDRPASSTAVL